MDRWIVYLGMAIMLAFLYLLYCASHTHHSPPLTHSSLQTSEKTTTISFLQSGFLSSDVMCCRRVEVYLPGGGWVSRGGRRR